MGEEKIVKADGGTPSQGLRLSMGCKLPKKFPHCQIEENFSSDKVHYHHHRRRSRTRPITFFYAKQKGEKKLIS